MSKWTRIPAAGRPRNFSLRHSRVSVSILFVYESIHVYISRAARRYPGRIVRRDYSSLPPHGKRGTALVCIIVYLFIFLFSSVDRHRVFVFSSPVSLCLPKTGAGVFRRGQERHRQLFERTIISRQRKTTLEMFTRNNPVSRITRSADDKYIAIRCRAPIVSDIIPCKAVIAIYTSSKSNIIAENPDGLHTGIK